MPCIVGTGSISTVNQDTKLVIQLPPGAAQDQTTCTSNVIELRMHAATTQNVDVTTPIRYTVTGLPSFVSVAQDPATATPFAAPLLTFTFNVSGIRHLTAASNSTITIANPIATNRTTTISLQVTPTPGQGFAQVATANPSSTTAGNPIDFTREAVRAGEGPSDHHLAHDAGSVLQAGGGGSTVCGRVAIPVL